MHKLIQILFAVAMITLVILTMGEVNYNRCKKALNQIQGKISDTLTVYEVYGFDPNGNPIYEPTTFEKVKAVFH